MERAIPARLRLLRLLVRTGFTAAVLAGCSVYDLRQRTITPAPSSIADDGETLAELELGARLVSGRSVPTNPAAGAAVIQRAAEIGDASAQAIIGQYYFFGIGVERKPELAASWLQKAAAQNLCRRASRARLSLPQRRRRGAGLWPRHAAGSIRRRSRLGRRL